MSIEAFTSVVYDLTSHSWTAASIAAKYYIGAVLVHLYTGEGLTRENFEVKIIEDSRFFIAGAVVAGSVLFAVQAEISPLLKAFSEMTAVAYLAYLFWKY